MTEDFRIDGLTVKEQLEHMAQNGNKSFTTALNPGVEHILGIRIPELRKLAARIAQSDWEAYLASADTFYMEERMLQGMVLGCIRPDVDTETYLQRITQFVRIINSWSVCDTFKFAGGKKWMEAHKQRLWEYLQGWMKGEGEYEVRFGIVMSMQLFIEPHYLTSLFTIYDNIHHEGYYVKMAIAWALSDCFVKFPNETLAYLRRSKLDKFTYNKTLQKITESLRVTDEQKRLVKAMKHHS